MSDDNMNAYEEIANGSGQSDPGNHGKVRASYDELDLTENVVAIGDKLSMPLIPEGARIIDAWIKSDNLGTAGIFDMGLDAHVDRDGDTVADDADSLVSDADAGGQAVFQRAGLGNVGIGKLIGKGGAQPYLIATEATNAALGDRIRACVLYIAP